MHSPSCRISKHAYFLLMVHEPDQHYSPGNLSASKSQEFPVHVQLLPLFVLPRTNRCYFPPLPQCSHNNRNLLPYQPVNCNLYVLILPLAVSALAFPEHAFSLHCCLCRDPLRLDDL